MKMPGMLGLKKRGFGGTVINRGVRAGMASRIITPWDWILAPALMSLALTIVLATAFQPFGFYLPEPVSPLILAFAWPLIRPSYIAPFIVGALGFFLDFFWGAPLGFWTIGLVLVYGVLALARTYLIGQEWMVLFGLFLLTELIFFGIGVLLAFIDTGAVVRLWGVVEQAFATTLMFPFVLILLEKYLHSDVRFQ